MSTKRHIQRAIGRCFCTSPIPGYLSDLRKPGGISGTQDGSLGRVQASTILLQGLQQIALALPSGNHFRTSRQLYQGVLEISTRQVSKIDLLERFSNLVLTNSLSLYLHTYMHRQREREGERERDMYIYMCVQYLYLSIYIYIYT